MEGIEYPDTSSWEEWQREYRYGAFYIFPPIGTIEPIDDLRITYDSRSASYCQAHISLSEPLPRPLRATDVEELRHRLASIKPFDVYYGPLRSFPPYPGVAYTITPEDRFRTLQNRLHAAPVFAGLLPKRGHIAPHMTIAEFITAEETQGLLQKLPGVVPEGRFLCDSIEYAVPNNNFHFERVLVISLGKGTCPRPNHSSSQFTPRTSAEG